MSRDVNRPIQRKLVIPRLPEVRGDGFDFDALGAEVGEGSVEVLGFDVEGGGTVGVGRGGQIQLELSLLFQNQFSGVICLILTPIG